MNIDDKIVELMQAEIDGVNSERESAELSVALAENPTARHHFDELKKIAEMLDCISAVTPPPDLKATVLAEVGQPPRPVVVHPAAGGARAALRYAGTAAAGVMLGVLGYYWTTTDGLGVDPRDVAGSMATHDAATKTTDIREFPLNFRNVTGIARLEPAETGFSLAIELRSEIPVEIELVYPEEVAFRGFFRDLGEIDPLEVAKQGVRWVQQGHDRVVFSLGTRGTARTSVEMTFSIEGRVVHGVTVGLPGSG